MQIFVSLQPIYCGQGLPATINKENRIMADITIAGVMRAGAYSPNHIGNDTAIFNLVAEQLRKRGCQVNVYSEEQFNKQDIEEPVVLAMCRERASIAKLQRLEDEGKLVINSGYGIENCTRERMTPAIVMSAIVIIAIDVNTVSRAVLPCDATCKITKKSDSCAQLP